MAKKEKSGRKDMFGHDKVKAPKGTLSIMADAAKYMHKTGMTTGGLKMDKIAKTIGPKAGRKAEELLYSHGVGKRGKTKKKK